jgi:hypothetical protein
MARPIKYDIKTDEVVKLASYGCTNVEIADFFGCDESLIRKSYSEYLTKGRADMKIRLRKMQFNLAEKSAVMGIWLGKQILNQTDYPITEDLARPLCVFKKWLSSQGFQIKEYGMCHPATGNQRLFVGIC